MDKATRLEKLVGLREEVGKAWSHENDDQIAGHLHDAIESLGQAIRLTRRQGE